MRKGYGRIRLAAIALAVWGGAAHASGRYEIPLPFKAISKFYHPGSPNLTLSQNLMLSNSLIATQASSFGTSTLGTDAQRLYSTPGLTTVNANTPLYFTNNQFVTGNGAVLSAKDGYANWVYGGSLSSSSTYDGKVDLGNDFNLFLQGYLNGGGALGNLISNNGSLAAMNSFASSGQTTLSNSTVNLAGGTLTLNNGSTFINAGGTNGIVIRYNFFGDGGQIITNLSSVPEPTFAAAIGAVATIALARRGGRRKTT